MQKAITTDSSSEAEVMKRCKKRTHKDINLRTAIVNVFKQAKTSTLSTPVASIDLQPPSSSTVVLPVTTSSSINQPPQIQYVVQQIAPQQPTKLSSSPSQFVQNPQQLMQVPPSQSAMIQQAFNPQQHMITLAPSTSHTSPIIDESMNDSIYNTTEIPELNLVQFMNDMAAQQSSSVDHSLVLHGIVTELMRINREQVRMNDQIREWMDIDGKRKKKDEDAISRIEAKMESVCSEAFVRAKYVNLSLPFECIDSEEAMEELEKKAGDKDFIAQCCNVALALCGTS